MNEMVKIPPQQVVDGLHINADLTKGPYFIDGCDTLPKIFQKRCAELGEKTAHREKDFGIWHAYSWKDWYDHARLIGLALRAMGLQRGECISIISEDNKEWLYIDLGVQCMNGIVTGIYTTDAASQLAYIVNDSGSRFLFVENDEQLDKFLQARADMPNLQKVIVLDPEGLHDFHDDKVMFLGDLYALGREELKKHQSLFEEEIAATKPENTAILIYTSGTTGMPKGVMLCHGNILFTISANVIGIPAYATDEQICFLPLCHIYERMVSVFGQIAARSTVNFAESLETVFDSLREVSPNSFAAVPRVWEKIYSRVTIMAGDATPFGRWAFNRAVAAGLKKVELEETGKPVPLGLKLQYAFWDFVLLHNVRRMLGFDRLRRGASGAAPISPEILKWFKALGINVLEGYGMSESAGVMSSNLIGKNKYGTVGQALAGAQFRIAPDGEIQYKAGNVFRGYWGNPEKTAEALTEDGWLRTGDVGFLDNEGFLKISGRLKDIIITAGGKNITPAEFENRLKFSPYISDAVIIGDKRKYLTCLVMIDEENVQKYAQDNRIPFSDFASLCARPEVQALIGREIENVNKDFARVEQVKKFKLIDILLTAEDDELTPTMKLKRSFVEKKHARLINEMYAEA
ncbi:long-chain fatty acid--CoA ligase [Rhizobium sp. L1K21]|uniref:AMP-dependent synthetase/ligase n=1 Tax=Rhizobium sp. L1K21 TaxID=2954933 RepID=UPI0020925A49|nr:long-chain fatty acid--CoA ligase [Rhizobium sp. L1K21]MCO6188316.1 long-chain fatty acid--CoA ligase [Rhizobium sp. L1K21]